MFRRLTTLLLIFLNLTVRAQSIGNQVLEEKFNLYHKAHPSTTLFLHIDKTIYTNNEKIWFSAYLLNYAENKKLHNILTVFLTRRDNREVILSEKFKLENGLSSGSLKLPDNTPPGSYLLVAYTDFLNKAGNPTTSFSTLLEVKNITQQGFSSSIILLDSVIKNGGVRAKLTVTRPDAKSKVFPFIKYSIGNRFKDSLLLKKNEFVITIPTEQLTVHLPQLLVSVKFNNQIQYLNASLPEINNQQISIRFFPEGGTLAAGLPSTIAWEAKTDKDIPLCVKGVLFKDNQAIDTIKTNSYGTGTFKLHADGKSNYTLKVNAGDYLLKDTVFALPKTNSTGFSLNITQAVVNDTLRVNLFTKEKKQVQLLIHNYYGEYVLFKAEAIPPLKLFSIPLNLLQKGISTITIIDNEGRTLAEQLFFAHYNNQLTASIKTEKAVYGKQDSIKVKLKLNDSAGKPISGILSVAVVQGNRLTSSFQSIDSYFYLNQLLGNLPQDPSGSGFHNKDYLEHILLTKGWRRYTWQDVISSTVKDTIQLYAGMPIKGSVKSNNKPLKAPVSIVALGGSNLGLITTQKDGSFILDESQLLTESDKKILFKISGNNNYKIHINDPYVTLNQKLAQQFEVNNTDAISNNLNSADQELKGLQKNIILQAVEIKANRGSSVIRGFKGEPGTNSCGDYVDEYDFLNYEYSENRYKPIVGKLYMKRTDLRGGRVWFKVDPVYYFGCLNEDNSRNLIISGIYNGKEYYGKMTDDSGLQYQSTLHWQSGLVTTDTGEAEFVFKTGDIADTFKIVVQGITNNSVVAGINTFTVK